MGPVDLAGYFASVVFPLTDTSIFFLIDFKKEEILNLADFFSYSYYVKVIWMKAMTSMKLKLVMVRLSIFYYMTKVSNEAVCASSTAPISMQMDKIYYL